MSERYQVTTPDEYGDAAVLDTLTNEFVQTNSGRLYIAPRANAQWTADSLNQVHNEMPGELDKLNNRFVKDNELVDEDGDDYTAEEHVTRDVWVGREVMIPDTGEIGTVWMTGPESFVVKFGGSDSTLDRFVHYTYNSIDKGWLGFPGAPIFPSADGRTLTHGEKIWLAVTAPTRPETEPMVPESELDAERDRSDRRHQRTMEYAAKTGKMFADLTSVRSRLVGLTRGMIPSMRERGVASYRTPEGALYHALDLIEQSLEETLEFLAQRIEEHRS